MRSKGQYTLSLYIDSDDDFTLDIGDSLDISADSIRVACELMISILTNAKLTYSKKCVFVNKGDSKTYDESAAWFRLRDLAVNSLNDGITNFYFSGNQTIECYLVNNK